MTISSEQLNIWEKIGPQTSSKNTYNQIKNLLNNHYSLNEYDFEIHLQGSYGNNTNIYGNSDVDIVVYLKSIYYSDISKLSASEHEKYNQDRYPAEKTIEEFKSDVVDVLKSHYKVKIKNKCLEVSDTPLDADVVVCAQYRIYNNYSMYNKLDYIEGIILRTLDGKEIVSFPKTHYDNGINKNRNVNKNFKKTVRIFKNMKAKLVNENILLRKTAPSYFIECLIYNVPNENFVNNASERVYNMLNWLHSNKENLYNLYTQDQIRKLFGEVEQQWNTEDCKKFIRECINLWNRD